LKIISKQHDYYDGVQAYNDSSIIFLRKQQDFQIIDHNKFDCKNVNHINKAEIIQSFDYDKIANPENDWVTRIYYRTWESSFKYFTCGLLFIGFCGKIYTGIMFELDGTLVNKNHKYKQFCYSINDVDKLFKKYTTKTEKKKYIKEKHFGHTLKYLKTKLTTTPIMISCDLFFKYNTPCFAILPSDSSREDKLIISPTLKDYQFTKVFDPYTAFQEIEMFISGVLGENKEPSTIDDKSMLYKKGFNDMSFKTYKGTKKPRSKRRNK